ncbi:MAG: YcnI family protein [Jatrophihabitantaceae bacterium]
MRTGRRFGIVTFVLLGLVAAGTLWAGAASAHVTVRAPGVSAGASDATITFQVPDEADNASTVGVKVQLPTDHPIAGVLVAPLSGWTATVKTSKLSTPLKTDDGDIGEVVSEIDWRSDPGAGIKPGYFGQFTIIAGKLPDDATSLTFKAIQTYSDGSTVSWIEVPAPGSASEPEHPAPTLQLAAATGQASPGSLPGQHDGTPTASTADSASKGAATAGILLGALGTLLGAAALALTLARDRRGRPATAQVSDPSR